MGIKLIVGLGNPELIYSHTRHNIGMLFLNFLSKKYNKKFYFKKQIHGYLSKINIEKQNIFLLKPTTFMNLSGISVLSTATYFNILSKEILIVHDEINMLPGKVKLKLDKGKNTHNGIKNIIMNLGKNFKFYRLSFGIGYPVDSVSSLSNFVLNPPYDTEKKLILNAIKKTVMISNLFISNNINNVINILNKNNN